AKAAREQAAKVGIDLEAVGKKLQDDGVDAFIKSFDDLMAALEKKRAAFQADGARSGGLDRQELRLGKYQSRVDKRLKTWQAENFAARMWQKNPTLWLAKPVPELADRLALPRLTQAIKPTPPAYPTLSPKVKI